MRVVDIDLSSFRIPPPPFWRGRYAPLVGFFGVLFLGLALAWAGGRAGAILGFLLMALVVLAAFASMFCPVPRMWRDRSRSSVTGERLPFARPEDLARTPQGASRPLGEMVESMRRLEEGAPAPEVVARPVPLCASARALLPDRSWSGGGALPGAACCPPYRRSLADDRGPAGDLLPAHAGATGDGPERGGADQP